MKIRDRQILTIAIPSIISNITVPLLGMIDVAIVGHMGSPVYIGAVAVGTMVFNLVYWLFGFLRMGTSGLTAQALGRRELPEVAAILLRSATVSTALAIAVIVLQVPLLWLMFRLMGPTPDVAPMAADYFRIVIWGAPASLGLFSLIGWFIGMQNTRIPMVVSITQNVVNIIASLTLVYGYDMKIEGVALGTVIAQYAGLALAVVLLLTYYRRLFSKMPTRGQLLSLASYRRFFVVNRDIILRTVCLVSVNLYFTSVGARQGAVILSVNTVLMQLYLFFSYFMDGFAYAGEAMCGRFYGARNHEAFRETLMRLFMWMGLVTAIFTVSYILGGMQIVRLLTNEQSVCTATADYIGWACLIPVAGCAAFIWDGVFVGITDTRGMLFSSFIATLAFLAVCSLGQLLLAYRTDDFMGQEQQCVNHFLWLAMIVFLLMRGVLQTLWFKRRKFPS